MPGAPNRPPPVTPAPAAAPPGEEAGRAVLRRLAPSRVALNLDLWKGAPSPELLTPFDRAEAAFAAGNWTDAQSHLDQLAVRFAEPRWPTLPVPFRELRASIPPPQPPHWDPDHGVPAAERDARRLAREAATQIALARASVDWMRAHALRTDDVDPSVASAATSGEASGGSEATWGWLDTVWAVVHERVPRPGTAPRAGGA